MIRSFGMGSIFAILIAAQATQSAFANDVIEAAGRYTVKITTAVDYSFGNEKKGTWRGSGFYDRGAGNSPGARGKRVTRFYPIIRAFLESVDLKKFNTFSRKSTMRILEPTGTVVGLEKTDTSLDAEMHVSEWFWSQEEVQKFLKGDIQSIFVSRTLPVEVTTDGESLKLGFHARLFK